MANSIPEIPYIESAFNNPKEKKTENLPLSINEEINDTIESLFISLYIDQIYNYLCTKNQNFKNITLVKTVDEDVQNSVYKKAFFKVSEDKNIAPSIHIRIEPTVYKNLNNSKNKISKITNIPIEEIDDIYVLTFILLHEFGHADEYFSYYSISENHDLNFENWKNHTLYETKSSQEYADNYASNLIIILSNKIKNLRKTFDLV